MDSSPDVFQPLLELLQRYRSDVHHLRPPATAQHIQQTEKHLGRRLPPDLQLFLSRWNGAVLFRGALRVRSTSQLAAASKDQPRVILFADGPREDDCWAFVEEREGSFVFGHWDGGRLQPRHNQFTGWLWGLVHVLEGDPRDATIRLDRLLQRDPHSPFLLLEKAEELLVLGDAEGALPLLRRATALDPDLLAAWHRLGDVLAASDKAQARWAYVKALRAVILPRPYPGARLPHPDLLTSLQGMFPPGDDAWERELYHLLVERVDDVTDAEELALFEAAGMASARVFLARGEREEARSSLDDMLRRSAAHAFTGLHAEPRLLLARVETELGHHDHAERRLKPVLACTEDRWRGRALLALGRLVVARQEPWAEEIITEAMPLLQSLDDRTLACLLMSERSLLHDRSAEAVGWIEQFEKTSAGGGDPALRATAHLLRGDIHRLAGAIDEAEAQYARAEALAVEASAKEVRLRLAVRAGDIALARGDGPTAILAYQRAMAGFQRLSLPIRAAWVSLRLGRLGDSKALLLARDLFATADLAAGVAAADAAAGDPGRGIGWHLARASEHARMRAEAQRARPPHTRADADRPERRLGAHQRAIAACPVGVVEVLGDVVSTELRTLESSSSRPGGSHLARYVAAVDLLSYHRSYEAAQLLLDQLFRGYLAGAPGQALKGAITRSPNMAMVDGLLDNLERADDPLLLSRTAEILGWRREETAVDRLRQLTGDTFNHAVRRAAIEALGRIGARPAIESILPALDHPELAPSAAVALLLLGDQRGVAYHAQLLARGEWSRGRSPGEIVGRFGDPSYLLLLLATADRDDDAALGALQGLGFLGDTRAVERLIPKTGSRNARVREVASGALEILSGHHEPLDQPQLRTRWQRFWREEGGHLPPGQRIRYGALLDPHLLIEALAQDDLGVRRAAFDELVITTGENLPFDADGAFRIQVHHRERWRVWWQENHHRFPPGRWMFHGQERG